MNEGQMVNSFHTTDVIMPALEVYDSGNLSSLTNYEVRIRSSEHTVYRKHTIHYTCIDQYNTSGPNQQRSATNVDII
jgi:hypothetical protein